MTSCITRLSRLTRFGRCTRFNRFRFVRFTIFSRFIRFTRFILFTCSTCFPPVNCHNSKAKITPISFVLFLGICQLYFWIPSVLLRPLSQMNTHNPIMFLIKSYLLSNMNVKCCSIQNACTNWKTRLNLHPQSSPQIKAYFSKHWSWEATWVTGRKEGYWGANMESWGIFTGHTFLDAITSQQNLALPSMTNNDWAG